jgi:ribonuclease-3
LAALLARVKLSFKNEQLAVQALTHKSFNESFNNSRLSVLGASIIELTITSHLYGQYPALSEFSLRFVTIS